MYRANYSSIQLYPATDITTSFVLEGIGIGSGGFGAADGSLGFSVGFRIDSARVTVVSTPLPAALPLFAAGLGIVTFLARRMKTAAARPA